MASGDAQRAIGRIRRRPVPRFVRTTGLVLALILVSLAGIALALRLDGHVEQDVGPFSATFSVKPSIAGGTDVQIPPLGSLSVASHDGPAQLNMRLDSVDQTRAAQLVKPNGVQIASDTAVPDVEDGVIRLALQTAGVSMLGAMVLGALVFRRKRWTRVAICGGIALATVAASGGIAFATFRPQSIEEPKYDGLLSNAPAVIGDAHSIADRFDAYREELQSLVDNVSKLYGTVSSLPVYSPTPGTIRVLHVSDLHLNPAAWSVIQTVVTEFHIDLVIDTGDLDDWGTTVESSFVAPIKKLKVPYVYIRGNHDSAVTAAAVKREPNAVVLENQVKTVAGLTIAGIGDPRFTPDKASDENVPDSAVVASGQQLAATVKASTTPANIALVHDPASAGALDGNVPLVLAGHLHKREIYEMPQVPGQQPTLMMVSGSTGGAGLRGLQGEAPTPLEMDVLYFDSSKTLQAYDEITLGGTGQSNVTIDRHLASQEPAAPPLAPAPVVSTTP
ncbi:MAG TPA: metallophosphoesterase [Micromonosporaceae bacterium]|jgi:predicted phosphodiesterase